MTHAEVPEQAREKAAAELYGAMGGVHSRWLDVDEAIKTHYRELADLALTAALPHLRVQETPIRKAHHCPTWEDPDGCRCTTPAPRPVVDREALLALFQDQQVGAAIPANLLASYRSTLADAILALLPTEQDTKGEGS